MTQPRSLSTRRDVIRAAWLLGAGATIGAVALPPIFASGSTARALQEATAPTKTREAELDELHGLQTKVSEPNVCTPAPTSTETATSTPDPATATPTVVPPIASGQPVPYGETWLITVLGIAPVPTSAQVATQGQLLQLNVIVANQSNDDAFPPFTEWLLTDVGGQSYAVSLEASSAIAGAGWGLTVGPGVTEDRSMIFDVPTSIGTTFTLESRELPTFRVALAIESRG